MTRQDTATAQERKAKLAAKLGVVLAQDRFKGTALMDAKREGKADCAQILEAAQKTLEEQLHDAELNLLCHMLG